jgi:hypothetical protein
MHNDDSTCNHSMWPTTEILFQNNMLIYFNTLQFLFSFILIHIFNRNSFLLKIIMFVPIWMHILLLFSKYICTMRNHVYWNQITLQLKLKKNSYTPIMQLSPSKYMVLINCHVRKSISYIIITSELKMGLLFNNLHTSYIHM